MLKVDSETGEIVYPEVRQPLRYDADRVSTLTGLACDDPSRTDASFKEETDINTIVERFGLTGQMPEDVKVPQEGDFTAVTDFQSAMNVVRAAQESFDAMPAEVRAEFGNDPGRFMAFVHDPDNRLRAEKLGLVIPKVEPKAPEPVLVKIAAEPAAGTSST